MSELEVELKGRYVHNFSMSISYETKTDEELMTLYAQNDITAFNTLFARHSGKVYGYILKKTQNESLAQDLVQTVFMKLHENREKFDTSQVFLAWFFVVIQNLITDYFRKNKIQTDELLEDQMAMPEANSIDVDLESALRALPSDYRDIVIERYKNELTFEQIAEQFQITPENARKKVSRGLTFLKDYFKRTQK